MGAGPLALLAGGLLNRLAEQGCRAAVSQLEPTGAFHAEIATAFDLHRVVRESVTKALEIGQLPIVLAGNCNTGVIGSLAAHDAPDVGLLWFDAHSDAETPESSTSGFLDGMGFALALGECWKPKLQELGWTGLDGRRAVLVGPREISAAAHLTLDRHGVAIISPEQARSKPAEEVLDHAVAQLKSAGVTRVHVHVDLDVFDPSLVGRANSYALPGGLSLEQLLNQLRYLGAEFRLASASIASYDPEFDSDGAVCAAAIEVVTLLALSGAQRPSSWE